jgi:hypothetical protein
MDERSAELEQSSTKAVQAVDELVFGNKCGNAVGYVL